MATTTSNSYLLPNCSVECDTVDSETTDFGSACIYLYTQEEEELYLILGYNAKHDNWCAFGGHAEPGETPKDTALRETEEETNGQICDRQVLEAAMYRPSTRKLIKTFAGRKPIYVFVVELRESELNANFATDYKNHVEQNFDRLPKERKENVELVKISFSALRTAYESHTPKAPLLLTASLVNGPYTCELRKDCVDTCRWLCHTTFPIESVIPMHE